MTALAEANNAETWRIGLLIVSAMKLPARSKAFNASVNMESSRPAWLRARATISVAAVCISAV
jgi:hypothetical protein